MSRAPECREHERVRATQSALNIRSIRMKNVQISIWNPIAERHIQRCVSLYEWKITVWFLARFRIEWKPDNTSFSHPIGWAYTFSQSWLRCIRAVGREDWTGQWRQCVQSTEWPCYCCARAVRTTHRTNHCYVVLLLGAPLHIRSITYAANACSTRICDATASSLRVLERIFSTN